MTDAIRRVPHCSHWGTYSILVDGGVDDGRIVGVEPYGDDPSPSPIIASVPDWAKPERRILRPMAREGWLAAKRAGRVPDGLGRGSERFVPLDWDEALTLAAGEIDRVRLDHGSDAIFAGSYGWTSCGRFHHAPSLLKRMLNLVGGYTGHVDTYSVAAGPVILRHVLGSEDACAGRANTLDSVAEHTETLVVFGALTPRTAQNEAGGIGAHRLEGYLARMVERGVRIVLVSPSRDDLPAWVPAEWWPIRPNTDTALMLGLAGEIVLAGGEDRDFLARATSGSEVYLDYLKGADGVPRNAEWAGAITGLDAGAIRALAAALPRTRSMLTVSWSLQRAHHGEQPFWAALGLAAVIGQIGLPGGGVGYGYGSLGGVGAPFAVSRSPAISQGRKPNTSFIPVARITDLLEKPGEPFDYEGRSYRYPETRLVFWAGGNPFHHHQDLNRLALAWQRPETVIVQDPMWTATALRADLVLPATTSIERNDLAGNRRSDIVAAMKQAIPPLGEARNDYDIFAALAGRLGVGAAFTEGRDEMAWIRHLYEEARADAATRFGHEMPGFDAFWEAGTTSVPVQADHVYLAAFRADPETHRLPTESGRIVLGSKRLAELGYEDCRSHPAWLPPAEWLGSGTQGFHLISGQPEGRLHSQLESAAASRAGKRSGRERMRIHPEDAEALDIGDGDAVRLWNARGACLATAEVTERIAQGVVFLPTGSWLTSPDDGPELSGNPNVLTLDIGTSRFGQGCSAHTCVVRVEPYRGNAPDPAETYLEELRRRTA
ncbi:MULTISPECIES: molybdopterin-dependent oxidoreductase [unclassified Haematobacter]|uniref:molybdopterin-dependent oxidoreductase n=1 Tax=unclassified Haematobacter TaxID=2640585 RepID=UPI0025C1AB35|nr:MULTISPECIES: molybdopterin-dependent oxidoreductase [unclassified Haematobacter]